MTSRISAEDNRSLIKLYFSWPQREELYGLPEEPLLFRLWLMTECADMAVVENLRELEAVKAFMHKNEFMFRPHREKARSANLRSEPRFQNKVGVLLKVSNCVNNLAMVGRSSLGTILDLGLHGMRVSSPLHLLEQSELDATVAPRGVPVVMYKLVVDTKWIAKRETEYQMGCRIREQGDFRRWRSDFGLKFVPHRPASA